MCIYCFYVNMQLKKSGGGGGGGGGGSGLDYLILLSQGGGGGLGLDYGWLRRRGGGKKCQKMITYYVNDPLL